MSHSLCFNDVTLSPVLHNNQPWIKSADLARALAYSDERKISHLYSRHDDEFTSDMSVVLNLGTRDTPAMTRIFSLRGCHLIAMFARTPVAKQFRRWVLDVLDKLAAEERALAAGDVKAIPQALTPSTADDRAPLRALVHAWAKIANVHHAALWPQVKAHFQLSRIDDLPAEWLPDALAFVQNKIDAVQGAVPQAGHVPALRKARRVPGPVEREINAIADELDGGIGGMYHQFMQTMQRLNRVVSPLHPTTYEALGWHSRAGFSIDPLADGLGAGYWNSIRHMEDAFSDARQYVRQFRTLARLHGM